MIKLTPFRASQSAVGWRVLAELPLFELGTLVFELRRPVSGLSNTRTLATESAVGVERHQVAASTKQASEPSFALDDTEPIRLGANRNLAAHYKGAVGELVRRQASRAHGYR